MGYSRNSNGGGILKLGVITTVIALLAPLYFMWKAYLAYKFEGRVLKPIVLLNASLATQVYLYLNHCKLYDGAWHTFILYLVWLTCILGQGWLLVKHKKRERKWKIKAGIRRYEQMMNV